MISGIIFEAIVPSETVLTLVGLAGGIAAGVVWVWRSPQLSQLKTEIESHAIQIDAWERRLKDAEDAHDETMRKLQACRAAMAEAGERIRELERQSHEDHDHPVPD